MKNTLLIFLSAVAGILILPDNALGHHGLAEFDTTSNVTVKATVSIFRFVNPHCIVEFEVKDDKGQIQNWQGELTSPNRLARVGWTRGSLKEGDEVTITGYRAKSGTNFMWITKLQSSDGREIKIVGEN